MKQEILNKFYDGCVVNDLDELIDWIRHAKKLHNVTYAAIARNVSVSERQLRRILCKQINSHVTYKLLLEICDFLNMRVTINIQLCPTRIPPKIIKDKYENEGKGITHIAQELGVSEHGVWKKLWAAGTEVKPITTRYKKRQNAHNIDLDKLKGEYNSGTPISVIALRYNATATTIYSRLRNAGLIKKHTKPRKPKKLKYQGETK